MKHQFFLTSFALFGLVIVSAQSAANSGGGTLSDAGGSAGYSFGNVFYKELSGSGGSTAPGTQAPYVITSTLGADQTFINLEMAIYPNPVTDYLFLKIDSENTNLYISELYDSKGSLLQAKKINGRKTDIIMSTYPSGVYFLSVKDNRKILKTFKIVKK